MGYYHVATKRKHEAVTTLASFVVDRAGRAAPTATPATYEARSVAVPFGNCIEPSDVKAGGKFCPVRFQCAGCGFYRPDPSYIPAIEEHLNALRADREPPARWTSPTSSWKTSPHRSTRSPMWLK